MKTGSIFSGMSGRQELFDKREANTVAPPNNGADLPAMIEQLDQNTFSWLTSTDTMRYFAELRRKRQVMLDEAMDQASTYPVHGNHLRIIKLLMDAHFLTDQINNYDRQLTENKTKA